ncbi:MAG: hypothetical protein ACLFPX_05985 [Candidatus Omnitrophota bacterium]
MGNKELNEKFSLSRGDYFFVRYLGIIHRGGMYFCMLALIFIIIYEHGISDYFYSNIWKIILIFFLLTEPLQVVIKHKQKRIPYKINIDIKENLLILFIVNNGARLYKFSDIKGIIDDPQYFIFYTQDRQRFAWSKNKDNNAELSRLLQESGIPIVEGKRSPFDYKLLWDK